MGVGSGPSKPRGPQRCKRFQCALARAGSSANRRQVPARPTPTYRVHLLDEATVVARGERVRVWFVPHADSWVRAADHPDATVEMTSSERGDQGCPPGTVWQRSVDLILPAETPLLSRTTSPRTEVLEPMEYLRRGKWGVNRTVQETWMRVVGNYRLARLENAPQSWLEALDERARTR